MLLKGDQCAHTCRRLRVCRRRMDSDIAEVALIAGVEDDVDFTDGLVVSTATCGALALRWRNIALELCAQLLRRALLAGAQEPISADVVKELPGSCAANELRGAGEQVRTLSCTMRTLRRERAGVIRDQSRRATRATGNQSALVLDTDGPHSKVFSTSPPFEMSVNRRASDCVNSRALLAQQRGSQQSVLLDLRVGKHRDSGCDAGVEVRQRRSDLVAMLAI